jgi:hypothetical protein
MFLLKISDADFMKWEQILRKREDVVNNMQGEHSRRWQLYPAVTGHNSVYAIRFNSQTGEAWVLSNRRLRPGSLASLTIFQTQGAIGFEKVARG